MAKKKFPVILELCNGIIVFEAAAMLHDTDAEIAAIDSALKTKKRRKYRGISNGTKKVPRHFSTRYTSVQPTIAFWSDYIIVHNSTQQILKANCSHITLLRPLLNLISVKHNL